MFTQQELIKWFRNPNDNYIVQIDEDPSKLTSRNLGNTVKYIDSKYNHWSSMNVYLRYGIDERGVIYQLNAVLDEDGNNKLKYKMSNVFLKCKQIARYKPSYVPLFVNPRNYDVEQYLFSDEEAIRAFKLIISKCKMKLK